jgi:D-alanyl-D-alanine carboxypeptidase
LRANRKPNGRVPEHWSTERARVLGPAVAPGTGRDVPRSESAIISVRKFLSDASRRSCHIDHNSPRGTHECAEIEDRYSVRTNGLEWGGDWKTFKDAPHYQLASGKSVAQIRALFEKGKAYI